MTEFDLASSELFEGLPSDEISRVCALFEERTFPAGSSLVREGDFSYRFFVVLEGEVDVHRDFEFVARMGPGDFFGEAGVMTNKRRNARVISHTRCRIASMMTWDFHEMVEQFPSVAAKIDAALEQRDAE